MFYGPRENLRFNDPDGSFEHESIYIIGQEYYEKVKKLYDDITDFNNVYLKIQTDEEKKDISPEAMRLYNRLGTISGEYNNGKPIVVFPFNTFQWKYENGKWRINNDYPVTGIKYDSIREEWFNNGDANVAGAICEHNLELREKQMNQELDRMNIRNNLYISLVVLGVLLERQRYQYKTDELRRRKRQHLISINDESFMRKLEVKCKKI
jgi:hypothetical protein